MMKFMKKMTARIVLLLVFSIILCSCESAGTGIAGTIDNGSQANTSTQKPTEQVTEQPTQAPSISPTEKPTETSSEDPTQAPTEHIHEYGDWVISKDAGCTENGSKTQTCACGDSKTDLIPATGHTPGADATCTTAQICTVCNAEIAPMLGHIPADAVEENRTEPTCTDQGSYYSVVYCSVCSFEISRENNSIPSTGHTLGADATCTTAQICTVCNAELVPMLGHILADAVVENRVEPTCTEQGSYDTVIYCLACNTEISREGEVIPALGHTLGADATCTTAQTCTACNAEITPALGHAPGADATCTTSQICTVCNAELVPMLGHIPAVAVEENRIEPTCTAQGSYDSVVYCSVCSFEISRENQTIHATGHTPGADATCTTAQICTVCNAELAPATGHSYNSAVTAPTCTEKGYTKYMCTICNNEYIADETNALGHNPGPEATSTTAQVCLTCGAELAPATGETPTEQPGEDPADKPTEEPAEPDSKPKKYFTLSFDDGITQDLKLIEIMKKYNVDCCSFNINTGLYGANWTWVGEALNVPTLTHIRFTEEELRTGIYDGFDVLVHTQTHPSLKNCSLKQLKNEIIGDADNIESITGVRPVGMAWPGGDTEFNLTNIRNILRYTDIRFARCTTPTYTFDLPEKFMTWYPTCSFSDARLFELAQQFIDAEPTEDMLFYVWGHGYELDIPGYNSYAEFEQLIKMISEADDIVLVTNTEFYELYKDQIESY